MNATWIKKIGFSALGAALATGTVAMAGPIGVTVDFSCSDGQGVKTAGGNVCSGGSGPNGNTPIKSWSQGFTGSTGAGSVNTSFTGTGTDWSSNHGDPAPGLAAPAGGTTNQTLTISVAGDYLFSFTGIDIGSNTDLGAQAIKYYVYGYNQGTLVFEDADVYICTSSNPCGPGITWYWVAGNSDLLTELVITTEDISGTTYYDNLEVDAVSAPEPGSLFLLGTGLLGLAFVAFRKSRTANLTLHS